MRAGPHWYHEAGRIACAIKRALSRHTRLAGIILAGIFYCRNARAKSCRTSEEGAGQRALESLAMMESCVPVIDTKRTHRTSFAACCPCWGPTTGQRAYLGIAY